MTARARENDSLAARRKADDLYRHLILACCHAADAAHLLGMGGEQEAARKAKGIHAVLLGQLERLEALAAHLKQGIPEPAADAVHRPAAERLVSGFLDAVRRVP